MPEESLVARLREEAALAIERLDASDIEVCWATMGDIAQDGDMGAPNVSTLVARLAGRLREAADALERAEKERAELVVKINDLEDRADSDWFDAKRDS